MTDAQTNSETDLLYGVPAIAAYLCMTQPQVYHLHNKGELPTFKIGGKVCARRSTLAAHFAEQERKAAGGE
jgi:predicted DNA-binding transcriptional regulator AlpA